MIAVIQRVKKSRVAVENSVIASIGKGLNILLGVVEGDEESDAKKLADKIARLRIFADEKGKMNLSAVDIGAEALVVSQFTLAADLSRGRRPSFENAMAPQRAEALYRLFCLELAASLPVQQGRFGAAMEVEIINDGPVTFILDSKEL